MIATGGGGRIDMLTPLRRLHARHGDVVMQQAGAFRMVNLFGPDANRAVLLDQDRIFSAKRPWDAIMGRIFPNGLLLRDGDDHKHHRKIMHTAFTRPAIRSYAERMNPMIEAHLAEWAESPRPLLAFRAYKVGHVMMSDRAASVAGPWGGTVSFSAGAAVFLVVTLAALVAVARAAWAPERARHA